MQPQRLVLFIDEQNSYKCAREAFFSDSDSHYYGQTNPIEVGRFICSRSPPNVTRVLKQVRIYTGRPDSTKEPRTYAAHMKQSGAWVKSGAIVVPRTLRYPRDWPAVKPQQKGVDVALAIDFVAMAVNGDYDVGVIASTDTDLRPALEFVRSKYTQTRHIEVVAWVSPRSSSRLSIPGQNIWCYRLDRADYDSVADLTDYNI